MAKYATNVSGAILLPSSIQVMESISGSVVPLAMFTTEVLLPNFYEVWIILESVKRSESTKDQNGLNNEHVPMCTVHY